MNLELGNHLLLFLRRLQVVWQRDKQRCNMTYTVRNIMPSKWEMIIIRVFSDACSRAHTDQCSILSSARYHTFPMLCSHNKSLQMIKKINLVLRTNGATSNPSYIRNLQISTNDIHTISSPIWSRKRQVFSNAIFFNVS